HRVPQGVEIENVRVEPAIAGGDRLAQRLHSLPRGLELVGERRGPLLELRARLLHSLDVERKATGALDQRRVRRAGLRRTAAQLFERLARLEQPPLRDAQALVGLPLRDLELADRRARLLLPPIERVAFVLRLPFF